MTTTVLDLSFTLLAWRPSGQDAEPLRSAHTALRVCGVVWRVCGRPGCLCVRSSGPAACLRSYGLAIVTL